MENSKSNQSDKYQKEQQENDTEPPGKFIATDLVSLEALVNVLIRNGVCTAEELFEEERTRRIYLDSTKNISLVKTEDSGQSLGSSPDKRNRSWLKRKMSKRRWTRKLGEVLLGWEWRKVQNNKGVTQVENFKK